MKIKIEGKITQGEDGTYRASIKIGVGTTARFVQFDLDLNSYIPDSTEPTRPLNESLMPPDGLWVYNGVLVNVRDSEGFTFNEIMLQIKHAVIRQEKSFSRMRREIEAFENIDLLDTARRERIPDSVRLFVWQRDQGKCIKCGSKEKLEFDHVIPVSKGGSNTERNIQLLCEQCNRTKGATI